MTTKTYLGDSVYAELMQADGAIRLTTENGLPHDPSNEIFLEAHTLRTLTKWHADAMESLRKQETTTKPTTTTTKDQPA